MHPLIKTLHPYEITVLQHIDKQDSLKSLLSKTQLQDIQIKRALQWLSNKGLLTYTLIDTQFIALDTNGERYKHELLPEIRLYEQLTDTFTPLSKIDTQLSQEEKTVALGILKKKQAIEISKQEELLVKKTPTIPVFEEQAYLQQTFPVAYQSTPLIETLLKRKQMLKLISEHDIHITLTEQADDIKQALVSFNPDDVLETLTPNIIKSGEWKTKEFRQFDVRSQVPTLLPARLHPFEAIIQLIRTIFIEMGFEEMQGPLIETAFWCLDSMWIPQDHPARDQQDTFYLPYSGTLPDASLVQQVKDVHEHGGKTGSKGYGYTWDETIAKQLLLRTHTTATTYRFFYEQGVGKKAFAKQFYVGRVFRNEAIDATHLPEFHQVEGFVMQDGLTIQHLMGFIKTFYAKLGIHNIRFKVTYNPYTEPSLEAMYYDEQKKSWLELINSGMFRPESLAPYGITKPVIAWGLGLERLAMILYQKDNIRDILGATGDIDWLRTYPIQRR